ncbi:hypothetical protein [Sphingomonas sp. GB1N7]|uniref:hypothetical protein n=1 Tax=Parasphingomonas caseinilytica TaxID=3096158 RepID=UPI002FC6AC8E
MRYDHYDRRLPTEKHLFYLDLATAFELAPAIRRSESPPAHRHDYVTRSAGQALPVPALRYIVMPRDGMGSEAIKPLGGGHQSIVIRPCGRSVACGESIRHAIDRLVVG